MADPVAPRRPWLKLWTAAYNDPDLVALSMENFGRWTRLLLFVALHGDEGVVHLSKGYELLSSCFRVRSAKAVRAILALLPGISVAEADFPQVGVTITFDKWKTYQVSSSFQRVRRFRQKQGTTSVTEPLHETDCDRYSNRYSNDFGNQRRSREEKKPPTPFRTNDPQDNPDHLRFNLPN